jgi:hypothetical protein
MVVSFMIAVPLPWRRPLWGPHPCYEHHRPDPTTAGGTFAAGGGTTWQASRAPKAASADLKKSLDAAATNFSQGGGQSEASIDAASENQRARFG